MSVCSLATKAGIVAAADIYLPFCGWRVDPEVWLCGYLWLCTQWGPVVGAAKYFLATSRGQGGRRMGAMDNYQKGAGGHCGPEWRNISKFGISI